MIAFAALLALAASCSAGSLDHLIRSSPDRNYLPPSQTPNNQYLPPAPISTPNRAYVPPTQPPNRVYVPPSPQPAPTSNRYVPPSPPSTPNNIYLPPTATPNKVYLPPSPTAPPTPVYLPPSAIPTPTVYNPPPVSPNNVYLPPSKPNNVYLPPSSSSGPYGSSGITGAVFRQQVSSGRPVAIVRQVNENNGDGVYTFSYETEDGTSAEERGQVKNDGAEGTVSAQGAFSFTAPDNVRYTVTYTADENGFQPQGAHLPVPPPIPEAILKSLADNAADEARGIVDDGSYREEPQGYPQGGAVNAGYFQRSGQTAYQSPAQGGYPSSGPTGYARESPAQGGYPSSGQNGYSGERLGQGYQRDSPSPSFNY